MGINIIKEEIKIIIETLGEQYAVINQQSGKIPQIELDIVMANIRRLYERLCDLNKLNSLENKLAPEEILEKLPEIKAEIAEKIEDQPMITAEPVVESKEVEIAFAEKDVAPVETKEEIIETKQAEIDLSKTKEIIFDLTEVIEEKEKHEDIEEVLGPLSPPQKAPKSGKKDSADLFSLAEKETLADKFKESQKSMHDKIATEKPDKTLADKIGKTSIGNQKIAIGINEKFLFINELFKGDIQEYNKTIDKLNSYQNLEECTGFLEEQKKKFKWDEKPGAYQKLEDLLIRKFL
jgi:hypothetical protein